jgi:DNA-binding NtrC family response regulator
VVLGGLRAPREGLVEARAPLYLGELSELSPRLQARLAQAWRRQQGAGEPMARWFAASSGELRRAVQEGRLREDLYYLLAVVRLRLPALRERQGDVPLLAEAFLARARSRRPEAPAQIHPDAMAILEQAPWYGNVRELENAMERAALFAQGPALLPRDLPDYLTRPTSEALSGFAPELAELDYIEAKQRIVTDFEQRYLVAILERSSGNISQAAKVAGMDRSNFRRLLKRHHFQAVGDA